MALTRTKARKMLREGRANNQPLTEKQRRYFGAVASGKAKKQDGGALVLAVAKPGQHFPKELQSKIDEIDDDYWSLLNRVEQMGPLTQKQMLEQREIQQQLNQLTKRREEIRAMAAERDPTFINEYNRTRRGFEKFYPGGVEMMPVYGEQELEDAFSKLGNRDLIVMDHVGGNLAGVPVLRTSSSEDRAWEDYLREAVSGGYKGQCLFGSCNFEPYARELSSRTGANIKARPEDRRFYGPNLRNVGEDFSFEDFFFGLRGPQESVPQAVEGVDFINLLSGNP